MTGLDPRPSGTLLGRGPNALHSDASLPFPSWPDLIRPSLAGFNDVFVPGDARIKSGHDDRKREIASCKLLFIEAAE